MKRFTLVFAVLALFAISGADELRSQIDDLSKSIHAAIMAKDIDAYSKALKAIAKDDFTCTLRGKQLNFDQMIGEVKTVLDKIPRVTAEDTIRLSLTWTNDTATATTEHKIKGVTMDDADEAHRYAFYGTSVDTYKKVDGKWVLAAMKWRSWQYLVDNKEVEID